MVSSHDPRLRAKAGQLAATWEQYETAVHASSNLKAPNECALADGIGAAATKIRTSARPAGSLGIMLHHLREKAEGDSRRTRRHLFRCMSLKLARLRRSSRCKIALLVAFR